MTKSQYTSPDKSKPTARAKILAAVWLPLALLCACSTEPTKPAETAAPQPKAAEFLTARSAFQKLYVSARGWARDAQPFRIQSLPTADGTGQDGKCAVWRSGFGSAAQRGVKSYTWSGSAIGDPMSRGVTPGTEDTYSASNASTQIFDMAFLKVDSDQALAVAQKHGGDKILEKNPETAMTYLCDWNHNTNQLVWHVIYGPNRDTAKLTVAVNASTGEFIRIEK